MRKYKIRTYYWKLVTEIISRWNSDDVSRLSAALAYYTIFSIAPLLIICITLSGFLFGNDVVKTEILKNITNLVGSNSADQVRFMIDSASHLSSGFLTTGVGFVVFLLGLMGFFWELQNGINNVWGVQTKSGLGFFHTLKIRLLSFSIVLVIAFLLLVSLISNTLIAKLSYYFNPSVYAISIWSIFNFFISFIIISFLFAMIFKILPDVILKWKDVWIGAIVTAFLFTIGKIFLEFYLGKSDIATAYGAAGSLIVILIWVYYSAQILFIGVEFTKVNTILRGTRIKPAKYAKFISSQN